MAANTSPIFPVLPRIDVGGAVLGPNANTSLDGTGSNVTLIHTAEATDGSFVRRVRLKAVGSPAATVARVFVCTATGSFTPGTTNTAANSALIAEAGLVAVTVSQTASSPDAYINLDLALPPSYKLFISFGTSTGASGTGYAVCVEAGDY